MPLLSSTPAAAGPAAAPAASQLDALLRGGTRARAPLPGAATATLLVASGRGGSGTSFVATLLAATAAGDGVRTLLVDADDLVGPLALLLGVQPVAGWQELRGGRVAPADVVTPVTTTLSLVAGGAPRAGAPRAPLGAAERRATFRALSALHDHYDLVVVDAGARLEALAAAIAPHARERLVAVVGGADPIALAATYAIVKALRARHAALPADVLVNRHAGPEATRCYDTIAAGAAQFLGASLGFAGAVPADPTIDAALRAGMPFLDAAAGSPAAIAAHQAATRALALLSSPRPGA
jgi:MinD-like ATPase involved in chromosome partitioning or flagellar assembly